MNVERRSILYTKNLINSKSIPSFRSFLLAAGLAISTVGCVTKPSVEDIERACSLVGAENSFQEQNGLRVSAFDPREEQMSIEELLEHVPTHDILVRDNDNTHKNITNTPDLDEDFPSISYRGQIAFVRSGAPFFMENNTKTRRVENVPTDLAGIYIINPDGSGEVLVSKNKQNETQTGYPVWSTDAKKLSFTRTITTMNRRHSNLYLYDLDSSSQRQLTSYDGDVQNLIAAISFSPDDRHIAYIDWQGLHVISLESGIDQKITSANDFDGETGRDKRAFWINNGQLIVENVRRLNNGLFSEDIQDPKDLFDEKFFIVNLDGSLRMDVTNDCKVLDH